MVEAYLELGANDYVTKPLDFPVVLARIRTQLALRHAVAQVKELEGKLDAHNRELRAATEGLDGRKRPPHSRPGGGRTGPSGRSSRPECRRFTVPASPGRSSRAANSPGIT